MVDAETPLLLTLAGGVLAVNGLLLVPQLAVPWYVQYLFLGVGVVLAAVGAHLELASDEEAA